MEGSFSHPQLRRNPKYSKVYTENSHFTVVNGDKHRTNANSPRTLKVAYELNKIPSRDAQLLIRQVIALGQPPQRPKRTHGALSDAVSFTTAELGHG
ncbi:hypothetical protein EVAR_5812_1 [Eumeta japonica]|uniref:Uncharacterized protein n=1 Tax=Eumeta variegata TaxID=151549 RepID=A0A4C1T7E0_EUMVA|nr:hypothetical protein EVAR_5812_1 [Eumeta japonica]